MKYKRKALTTAQLTERLHERGLTPITVPKYSKDSIDLQCDVCGNLYTSPRTLNPTSCQHCTEHRKSHPNEIIKHLYDLVQVNASSHIHPFATALLTEETLATLPSRVYLRADNALTYFDTDTREHVAVPYLGIVIDSRHLLTEEA